MSHLPLRCGFLLMVAGALAVAGCTPITDSPSTASPDSSDSSGPVALTLQHSLSAEGARTVLDAQIAAYESEHPGVTIEVSYVPWNDLRTTTLAKVTSGEVPDIMYGADAWGEAEFGDMGLYLDLTDYLDADFLTKFGDTAWDAYGKTALPFSTSYEAVVFYRPDLFAAAGVTPPAADKAWTWAEFIAAAKKLTTDANGDGKPEVWGYAERGKAGSIAAKSLIPYLMSYGTDIIKADGDGWAANANDPKVAEALQREISLMTTEKVMSPDVLGWDLPEAIEAWNSDRIAMLNIGSWFAGNIKNGEFGDKYDIMLFPTDGAPTTYISHNYWNVASSSKHPQESFDFLKWLYEPERLQELAKANNNAIVATLDAQKLDHYSEANYPMWATRLSQWQPYGKYVAAHPNYITLWTDDVVPFWQAAATGQQPLADALSQAQTELERDLD